MNDGDYLDIAEIEAKKGTCLRRKFGAVITNRGHIISKGYASATVDTPSCDKVGFCYRSQLGARKGEHYEFCRAVHAEQNAILQASITDLIDGTLYLVGLDSKTNEPARPTVSPDCWKKPFSSFSKSMKYMA